MWLIVAFLIISLVALAIMKAPKRSDSDEVDNQQDIGNYTDDDHIDWDCEDSNKIA